MFLNQLTIIKFNIFLEFHNVFNLLLKLQKWPIIFKYKGENMKERLYVKLSYDKYLSLKPGYGQV